MSITVGDLFAGIGGIALGFKQSGFDIKWAIEKDKYACITYRANFKHTLIEDRIENVVDFPYTDVITAGFPCQPFSIAGLKKGFEDIRGNLFFEIMRAVSHVKPKVVFLENVKNLVSHDKGNTFKVILSELEKHGYNVKYKVLNTYKYSTLPQNRERIYIVAFKDIKHYEKFKFPESVKNTLSIKSILEDSVSSEYYYDKVSFYSILEKEITKPNTIYQWRRTYVRENKKGICPTLTANMGTGGHNVPLLKDLKGIRKLTPKECAKLQGFSDYFNIPMSRSQAYKQIGNSVSVPVVKLIADEIKKIIKSKPKVGDILDENVNKKYTISDKAWSGMKRRKSKNLKNGKGFGYKLFNKDSDYTSTLVANYNKDGSAILIEQDKNPRRLTPKECSRLQGFPDSFNIHVSDTQAYIQLGNSVSVPIIKLIAGEIKKAIK